MKSEREELSELLTEAHGLIKDLRATIRQAEITTGIMQKAVEETIHESFTERIEQGMMAYHAALATAIDNATERIYERFNFLTEILLAEGKTATRSGRTVEDVVNFVADTKAAETKSVIKSIIQDKGV